MEKRENPRPGEVYKHFKRENYDYDTAQYLYRIVDIAYHSETKEQVVVYRQLYYPYELYVRPLDMFMSPVDRAKYPDVKQKWRFEKIGDGPITELWREQKKYLLEAYKYQNVTAQKGQTVFTGSSLMEMFPIDRWTREIPGTPVCYNRGVGGFKTADMLDHMDEMVLDLEPGHVFINIGTNDLADPDVTLEQLVENYGKILDIIKNRLPQCRITMMAYYPGNIDAAADYMKECLTIRNNKKIAEANALAEKLAAEKQAEFINVNVPLMDSEGRLRAEYTIEGLHMNEEGYRAILPLVLKYL